MPNNDYIKRSDALAYARHAYAKGLNLLMAYISVVPAVDVEPIRHGRWIERGNGRNPYCNECYGIGDQSPFCKHCGAKMDAEPPKEK